MDRLIELLQNDHRICLHGERFSGKGCLKIARSRCFRGSYCIPCNCVRQQQLRRVRKKDQRVSINEREDLALSNDLDGLADGDETNYYIEF